MTGEGESRRQCGPTVVRKRRRFAETNAKSLSSWFSVIFVLLLWTSLNCCLTQAYTLPVQCMPLEVQYCSQTMRYNFTVATPRGQLEASQLLRHFETVVASRLCHPHFFTFLCLRLAPACLRDFGTTYEEKVILPCRAFCQRMQDDCMPKIMAYDETKAVSSWPPVLECSELPEENCADPSNADRNATVETGFDVIPARDPPILPAVTEEQANFTSTSIDTISTCPPSMRTFRRRGGKFAVGGFANCGVPCTYKALAGHEHLVHFLQLFLSGACVLLTASGIARYYVYRRVVSTTHAALAVIAFCLLIVSLTEFITKVIIVAVSSERGPHCDRSTSFVHQTSSRQDARCMASFIITYAPSLVSNFSVVIFIILAFLRYVLQVSAQQVTEFRVVLRILWSSVIAAAVAMTVGAIFTDSVAGSLTYNSCDIAYHTRLQFHVLPLVVSVGMVVFLAGWAYVERCHNANEVVPIDQRPLLRAKESPHLPCTFLVLCSDSSKDHGTKSTLTGEQHAIVGADDGCNGPQLRPERAQGSQETAGGSCTERTDSCSRQGTRFEKQPQKSRQERTGNPTQNEACISSTSDRGCAGDNALPSKCDTPAGRPETSVLVKNTRRDSNTNSSSGNFAPKPGLLSSMSNTGTADGLVESGSCDHSVGKNSATGSPGHAALHKSKTEDGTASKFQVLEGSCCEDKPNDGGVVRRTSSKSVHFATPLHSVLTDKSLTLDSESQSETNSLTSQGSQHKFAACERRGWNRTLLFVLTYLVTGSALVGLHVQDTSMAGSSPHWDNAIMACLAKPDCRGGHGPPLAFVLMHSILRPVPGMLAAALLLTAK